MVKTKFNSGARGVNVLAGVGHGKVLMWEYLDGPWGGAAAKAAYEGPISKALKAEYPHRKRFTVLEDNDPSGFKSGMGESAKKEVGFRSFVIPKRSPCLKVCDYFLWYEVNRRMREQETSFKAGRRESRKSFLARLRRTAMGLPAEVVSRAVGDMRRRCVRLVEADGGNIEEGGLGQR